jgi:hypothetical protein
MICFAVPLREHYLAFGQTVETLIITVPLERKQLPGVIVILEAAYPVLKL